MLRRLCPGVIAERIIPGLIHEAFDFDETMSCALLMLFNGVNHLGRILLWILALLMMIITLYACN